MVPSPMLPRINAPLVQSLLTVSFLVDPEDLAAQVDPEDLAAQEDPEAPAVQVAQEVLVDQVKVELHFASTHHCTPFPALPFDLPRSCDPLSGLP